MKQYRVDCAKAKEFVKKMFIAGGADETAATNTAEVIVEADMFGIQTHGLECLGGYIRAMREGRLDAAAKPEIVKESPVYALVDGHNSLGHATAVYAMDLAIQKAKQSGVGVVVVRHGAHYGFAGYYPLMAIKEKMMGFTTSNTTPCMVPTGALQVMIGSNPISAGFPADPYPFLLDISTCAVAGGKIDLYAKLGKDLDPSWTLGKDGKPGVDGDKVLSDMHDGWGGIQPMGGHKGYGFGLLMEILTGVIAGGKNSDQLKGGQPEGDQFSHMFFAMDYGVFGDREEIERSLSDYLQRIRDAKRLDPNVSIITPGEREFINRAEREENGILLLESTRDRLAELAAAAGIDASAYLGD